MSLTPRRLRQFAQPSVDNPVGEPHIPNMRFTVTVAHDEAEGVWYVQASDVPGLNAEALTLDELIDVITDLVPDLLSANLPHAADDGEPVSICVQHLVEAGRAHAA